MNMNDPAPAQWATQARDVARRPNPPASRDKRLQEARRNRGEAPPPDASSDMLLEEARLILGENPALDADDRVAAIGQLLLLATRAA